MNERTLYVVSIIITVLGLLFLYLYVEEVDLNVKEVDTIQPSETVKLRGVLTQVDVKDKVIFLQLQGQKEINTEIILFTPEELFLKTGDYVEVEGTVQEYQGKTEVVASSVKLK